MNYYNEIQTLLNKLPKRYCVRFALYCAEDVIDKVDTKDKANAEQCIALVKEWLELEPSKELEQKLKNAASTASTAYATYAASAAYTASTVYAASTASAAYATYAASAEKLKKYYEYLLRMIHDIPRVEKEIYCLEER